MSTACTTTRKSPAHPGRGKRQAARKARTARSRSESHRNRLAPALCWHPRTRPPGTGGDRALIRPVQWPRAATQPGTAQPELLTDRLVLIGGQWGINDQFKLRGQSDAFFGVNLHAWVTATELAPPLNRRSRGLTLEIVIGLLAGTAFAYIWKLALPAARAHSASAPITTCCSSCMAFGLPLVWVMAAAHLAKLGLVLGAAGMPVLSAAADVVARETILEAEEKQGKHLQGGAAPGPCGPGTRRQSPSHANFRAAC